MIKQIKLNKEQLIRLGDEPFFVQKNDDLVFVISSSYNLSNARITLQNGEIKGTFKLSKEFIVPKDFLFSGQLAGTISQYVNENETKRWFLSPLTIIEADNKVEIFELLASLEKRVAELEEKNKIIL